MLHVTDLKARAIVPGTKVQIITRYALAALRMCLAQTGNEDCDRARAEVLIVRPSCRLCALGCCAALLRLGYALRCCTVRLY